MKEEIERIKTSLEIDEDIDLHIKSWTVQRIGWAFMLAVIVLALLGLFGNGVLSERNIVADSTTLIYERFARYENNTPIEVEALNAAGSLTVKFSPAFGEWFKVEQINPEPVEQRVDDGSTVYTFKSGGKAHATFYVSPRKQGQLEYSVRVNAHDFHPATFIYP